MILNENNTLVIIIDIQEKLLNAVFNKNTLTKNASILAKVFNRLEIPIIITEQYPKGLGNTIPEIKTELTNAHYIEKVDFSALNKPELIKLLRKYRKKHIIIFGIETHICVYQTVTDLLNKNLKVTVIKNACGSRSEEEYTSALNCMLQSGAQIKTAEMVLFELLKTSTHRNFKEIQALIK